MLTICTFDYIMREQRQIKLKKVFTMEKITLDKLPLCQEAIIDKVGGEGSILRRRLLDMGLTPRTRVMVRKRAPLGDPLEISLRGYELTLRAEEAAKITVTPEVSEA